jgi:hypothetical protein
VAVRGEHGLHPDVRLDDGPPRVGVELELVERLGQDRLELLGRVALGLRFLLEADVGDDAGERQRDRDRHPPLELWPRRLALGDLLRFGRDLRRCPRLERLLGVLRQRPRVGVGEICRRREEQERERREIAAARPLLLRPATAGTRQRPHGDDHDQAEVDDREGECVVGERAGNVALLEPAAPLLARTPDGHEREQPEQGESDESGAHRPI